MIWIHSRYLSLLQLLIKLLLGIGPVLNIFCTERLFSSLLTSFKNNSTYVDSYYWSVGLIAVNLSIFILNSLNSVVHQKIMYTFEQNFKSDLLNKSIHIPYQLYESSDFQNKYMRATQSSHSILSTFEGLLLMIQSLISLISVTIYLVNIHILFTLIIFIMILPLIYIELKFGRNRYDLSVDLSENAREMGYLETLLINKTYLKEIKMGKKESYIIELWKKAFKFNAKSHISLEVNQMKFLFAAQLIVTISFIFSTTLVINMISNKILSIAAMTAVIQAIQNLQGIIPSFANNLANSYQSSLSVKEFKEFSPLLKDKSEVKYKTNKIDTIEIINLNYSYPGRDNTVLNNVNLNIQKGDKIAIMGNNGSGKTTLIKCLIGLYNTEKSIKINEKFFLEEIDLSTFWDKISILFQDFNRYEFNVLQNIVVGESNEITKRHHHLLELVGLKKFIEKLPDKYDTQLGNLFNHGTELSGGQWQKLALVRVLQKKSDLLILDEPTSAMDAESEYNTIRNVLSNLVDESIIYITHRVNVAKLADRIIYMKDGHIIEDGHHEELLSLNGEYSKLYHGQVENLIGEGERIAHV